MDNLSNFLSNLLNETPGPTGVFLSGTPVLGGLAVAVAVAIVILHRRRRRKQRREQEQDKRG